MNITIIYGSNTGNTENLVKFLAQYFKDNDVICNILNSAEITQEYKFSENEGLVILSCSTWGIDPPVMQEDFEIFWRYLDKSSIKGKKFAILGLGDRGYPYFCNSLEVLEEEIEKHQGNLLAPVLPISDNWEDSRQEILIWLKNLKNLLLSL